MQTRFDDLRQFIAQAEELGEVEHITGADPYLEIGALFAINGQSPNPKLLLFDEIKGYPKGFRICTNVIASKARGRMAQNIPVDLQGKELEDFLIRRMDEKTPVPPEYLESAPILENVLQGDDVDLTKFPAPTWHELDGGPYIGCCSAVLMRDPYSGFVNIGSYRSQLFDRNHVGLHTAHGHHGQIIRDHWFEQGLDCPVVISLGQEPSLLVASNSGEPWDVSELETIGFIRGAPVPVIKGRVTDIPLPAGSEIVLEGFIMHPDHEPMRVEGAFGEASGYYSHIGGHAAPVVRIDAVYHRNDPIINGEPPYKGVSRDGSAIRSSAEVMRELKRAGFHDIRGVGNAGPFTVVSVHQMYAGHAKRVADFLMSGVNAAGQNRPPRMLVLVDEDIDPNDAREVFWAVSSRIDPVESVHIYRNMWIGPTAPRPTPEQKEIPLEHGLTLSSMLIDATRPFAWKEHFPPVNDLSPELRQKMIDKWEFLRTQAAAGGRGASGGSRDAV